MTTLTLLAAAAEHAEEAAGAGPYIAGAIAAGVFLMSAIVLRSFRDVAHRGDRHDVHGNA